MQNSFPLGAIIRRIGQAGIAKSNDNFLKLTMASLRACLGTRPRADPMQVNSPVRPCRREPIDAADHLELVLLDGGVEDRRCRIQLGDVVDHVLPDSVAERIAALLRRPPSPQARCAADQRWHVSGQRLVVLQRFDGRRRRRRSCHGRAPGSAARRARRRAYSILATISSLAKLPATRQTKRSPRPLSKAYSGAMRESAQLRMAA